MGSVEAHQVPLRGLRHLRHQYRHAPHVTDAPGNNVFIAGTVETARINSTGLHMNNLGIGLGEFQVTGDYDLSKHILLYDGAGQHTYGFNVQWNGVNPAHFNYVAGLDGVHQFP